MLLLVASCVALCLASCRQSHTEHPTIPTIAQVRTALAGADVRSPYKSYVVGKLEPAGNGGFVVLFQPTDYRGTRTAVPFPLEGYVTNNGYIVNCLEQGENGDMKPEGKAIFIPFDPVRAGDRKTHR